MPTAARATIPALPAGAARAQRDDWARAGDVLAIKGIEPSLDHAVTVLFDGRSGAPLAGTPRAGGQTSDDVQAAVGATIGSNLDAPPDAFANVRPALCKPAAPMTTDLDLLSGAASPTFPKALDELMRLAAAKRIQRRRTAPATRRQQRAIVDDEALTDGATLSQDIVLTGGGVIPVPERRLLE